MTQTSGFYDGTGIDYDRATIAAAYARFLGNGVIPTYANSLLVYQRTPNVTMGVSVTPGGCNIEGYWHTSDAAEDLTIEAAEATTRYDLIVAQLTTTGSPGSLVLAVHKGTAGAGVPEATWSSPVYELVLAVITVAPTTTAITTAMISDKRADDTLCGYARPYACGKQAYANVSMAGFKLTGCANPTSDQDYDTKYARNAAILVAVPSQAGNNLKYLATNGTNTYWSAQGAFFLASASNTLVKSSDTEASITASVYTLMKTITTPIAHMAGGTYRVKFSLRNAANTNEFAYGRIYVNGVAAGTARILQGSGTDQTVEYSEDITISAVGGANIQVYCYHYQSSGPTQSSSVLNFRVYCTEAVPW